MANTGWTRVGSGALSYQKKGKYPSNEQLFGHGQKK
jgi:hypothetical protein